MDVAELAKIKVGITTKDEMVSKFGTPLAQSFGSEGKLSLTWHYVYVGPFGSGMKQQNLTALFDQQSRVERYNVIDSVNNGPRPGQ